MSSNPDRSECGVSPISSFLDLGDVNSKSNAPLSGVYPGRYKGEGWPVFPYLSRASVEQVLPPNLVFAAIPARASSDPNGSFLPVFEIIESWVPGLVLQLFPTLLSMTGSLVLLAGYDSSYPEPFDGYCGGRLLSPLGCVNA